MKAEAVIIGAGPVGAATALALAERGISATVLEAETEPCSGAARRNGGQLSWFYTDALASPTLFSKMPGLALGRDPGFRLNPSLILSAPGWLARFMAECLPARSEANTLAVLGLALHSKAVLDTWRTLYSLDYGHRNAGKIHVFDDAAALEGQRERMALKNTFGAGQSIMTRDELFSIEPALASRIGPLAGGLFSPRDAAGDPHRFVTGALAAAKNLVGTQLVTSFPVSRINISGGKVSGVSGTAGTVQTRLVILCSGHQAPAVAATVGERLPSLPAAGYALEFPVSSSTPEISITDTAMKAVIARIGDVVRVAAWADLGDVHTTPPPHRIKSLLEMLKQRWPALAETGPLHEPWVGMRPLTPDGRPVIRKSAMPGLFLNCGHGALGWTLAAGSATMCADLVTGTKPGVPVIPKTGPMPESIIKKPTEENQDP